MPFSVVDVYQYFRKNPHSSVLKKRQEVSPPHWRFSAILCSITPEKTISFIFFAVRTSDLIQ
jgi:hypothetical protein